MLYLLHRTSDINVINGLDLSPGQIDRLRSIAADVEQKIPPYSPGGNLSPELREVADAYLSLNDSLLRDDQECDSLKKRVSRERSLESQVIRCILTCTGSGDYGSCMKRIAS